MVCTRTVSAVLIAGAAVAGCASSPSWTPPSLITDSTAPSSAPPSAPTGADYQLTPQELGYNCKKLAGVMQVRILQVRQYDPANNGSAAARGMQSVATPIFGGTTVGIDPAGQHQRDLAMLQAYNGQLARKNCKTFDLAAELAKTDLMDTPQPTVPAKSQ
jgi:hypothetical protein